MGKITNISKRADNIFLIGTAECGPTNTPVLAKSVEHIKSVFGNEGSLIEAYLTIADSDIPCNVHLVKTSGSHAELFLNVISESGDILEDCIYIKSKDANEISNKIEVYLDNNVISFSYPEELGGHENTYNLSDYATIQDLISTINKDSRLKKGHVYCTAYCEPHIGCKFTLAPVNDSNLKLNGGNSGLDYNKNMMHNCMNTTYSILEGYPADIVIPLEMYYDDTLTSDINLLRKYTFDKDYITLTINNEFLSFYKQLVDFCRVQLQSGVVTHGVMGISPNINRSSKTIINRLSAIKEANKLDEQYDQYAHMVSVVASDLYALYGTSIQNGYIGYGVLLAHTAIAETTTNAQLPSSFALYDYIDQDILKKVNSLGFVSFRKSPKTRLVHVLNGITMSKHKELKYLVNTRSAQVVMRNFRVMLTKFIGRNIDELIKSGKLNKDISSLISELDAEGLIKDFSSINVSKKSESHLVIDLSFRTKYMLEDLKSYSGLTSVGV